MYISVYPPLVAATDAVCRHRDVAQAQCNCYATLFGRRCIRFLHGCSHEGRTLHSSAYICKHQDIRILLKMDLQWRIQVAQIYAVAQYIRTDLQLLADERPTIYNVCSYLTLVYVERIQLFHLQEQI